MLPFGLDKSNNWGAFVMQKEFEVKIGDILVTPRNFALSQYKNLTVTVIYISDSYVTVQTLWGHKIDCTLADFVTRQGLSKKKHRREKRSIPTRKRYEIFERDDFRCQICGRSAQDDVTLELDHIIPYSQGGKTTPENLRVLCQECNRGKAGR